MNYVLLSHYMLPWNVYIKINRQANKQTIIRRLWQQNYGEFVVCLVYRYWVSSMTALDYRAKPISFWDIVLHLSNWTSCLSVCVLVPLFWNVHSSNPFQVGVRMPPPHWCPLSGIWTQRFQQPTDNSEHCGKTPPLPPKGGNQKPGHFQLLDDN